MNEIMTPFSVKYHGYDADRNSLDAFQLGTSLHGAAKLYSIISHYVIYGEILKARQKHEFRCLSSAPQKGSYEYFLLIATAANEYQMFNDIYKKAMDWLVATIAAFIKDSLAGRGSVGNLVRTIDKQKESSDELSIILANGLVKSNDNYARSMDKLIDTLPMLLDASRSPMKKLVAPIGGSCSEMISFTDTENEFSITEPEALAIKSELNLEVGEMENYTCNKIYELNLGTGACKLYVDGFSNSINGKISDPVIDEPNNIYSKCLNEQKGFNFSAKPVTKDGGLHKLFISDASEIST